MQKRMPIADAALKGAVASVVAGWAIKLVWQAGQRWVLRPEERVHSPTAELVRLGAEQSGAVRTPAEIQAVAGAMYGGTMLTYGVLYGIVQSRFRPPAIAHGMLLAGIMYAANFPSFGVLPKKGIMPPPSRQRPPARAVPIVAQLAYGVTLPAVFAALAGTGVSRRAAAPDPTKPSPAGRQRLPRPGDGRDVFGR